MVFKNLRILALWTKVALALEVLMGNDNCLQVVSFFLQTIKFKNLGKFCSFSDFVLTKMIVHNNAHSCSSAWLYL